VAIYDIYIAINLYGPALNQADQILEPNLATQDITLRMFFAIISVVQLLMAYEVVTGGSWAYLGGLAISAIDLAIYVSFVSSYYAAPTRMEFRTPLLLASFGVSIASAAVIWVYFNLPRVRGYLTRWM